MFSSKINYLIQLCAFFVFIGRAYQFYFFGAPFRAILWDESLLSPIIEGIFNYSWFDYATNLTVNQWIENLTKLASILFLFAAITCLFWDKIKHKKIKKNIVVIALFVFALFAISMFKDKNFNILTLFELSMQAAAPLLLITNTNFSKLATKNNLLFLKITIALTFIPHGILAMGILFVPGHFIDMTIKILGVNETQAISFLFVVGLIDIVFSFLLFIPKLSKIVLIYMIMWGFATAFARIFSGFNSNFMWTSIHSYSYLVIYRLAHGIIPWVSLLIENKLKKKTLL